MNKKMLTLMIVLGVILVVLVVLVSILVPYFGEKIQSTTVAETTTTVAPENLGANDEGNLLSIKIEAGSQSYTFVRENSASLWEMEGMPAVTLDQSQVNITAGTLSKGAVAQDVNGNFEDLDQYGLKNPSGKVILTYADGAVDVYYVGAQAMSGSRCYAYKEGTKRLVLMSNTFYSTVMREPYSYAMVKTFSVDGNNLKTLRISKGDQVLLKLVNVGEESMSLGEYIITEPYQVLAVDEIKDFTEQFSALSISGTVDVTNDNLAAYGLAEPAYTIEGAYDPYYVSGTGDFTMYVGDVTEGGGSYYICFEGEEGVYTIPTDQLSFATNVVTYSLVNRMYMLYSLKTMDKLTITANGATHDVKITQPAEDAERTEKATYQLDGKETDRQAGVDMYLKLISLSSHGEVPSTTQPDTEPTLSVTLTFASDTKLMPGVYTFYPYEHDYYSVYVDGLPQFYTRTEKVDAFLDAYAAFLETAK